MEIFQVLLIYHFINWYIAYCLQQAYLLSLMSFFSWSGIHFLFLLFFWVIVIQNTSSHSCYVSFAVAKVTGFHPWKSTIFPTSLCPTSYFRNWDFCVCSPGVFGRSVRLLPRRRGQTSDPALRQRPSRVQREVNRRPISLCSADFISYPPYTGCVFIQSASFVLWCCFQSDSPPLTS